MDIIKYILNTFLKLTSLTVPYGVEEDFMSTFVHFFPEDLQMDKHGNYFYEIGESKTVFTSHLDTVSDKYKKVKHVIKDNMIMTDGKSTLGADDKAGVTIMLWMILNNVPGIYYFFIGEEVGCVGSSAAAKDIKFLDYKRMISFDRRDTNSVITFQSFGRSCSNEFADALCDELNLYNDLDYIKDDGGIFTDSAEFMEIIPECSNISVGYYNEHSEKESQDIDHLTRLADACTKVDWENLPTKRDPDELETYIMGFGDFYDFYDDDIYTQYSNEPKEYYDDGSGELMEITTGWDITDDRRSTYQWISQNMVKTGLDLGELEKAKECYLEMDDDFDRVFYKYLKEYIV